MTNSKRLFITMSLICILLNSSALLKAQIQNIDDLVYKEDTTLSSSRTKELRIEIQDLSFFRNNEYKGRLVKGYTLPGSWLLPSLSYQPISKLKLEIGAYMLRYWGENIYPNTQYSDLAGWKGNGHQKAFHTMPFLRAHYAATPNFSLVLGNIYGRNNHNLIEPLFNREMSLTSDPEAGVQMLWNTRPFSMDMWINWENFIFQGDDHQEEFTFGLSTRFKANRPLDYRTSSAIGGKFHVYFPLQIIFKHQGGEINTSAVQREVKTWLNAAAGVGVDIKIQNRFFKRLNIEGDVAYYAQQKGTTFPFDNGFGLFGKATADIYKFRLNAGYWQCHNFVSLMGNPLFGAISVSEQNLTYRNPKMAFLNLEFAHRIAKGFALGVHADLYNNFSTEAKMLYIDEATDEMNTKYESVPSALSFAAGIYLKMDFDFLIKRFK